MLALGRKVGQRLVVGKPGDVLTQPIIIEMIGRRFDTVSMTDQFRIGIDAQRDVRVLREELIQREEAAS